MKSTIALAVATVVAAVGITASSAIGAGGGKKPLSPGDTIALVNEMVAAGKIDQATADKKIAFIKSGGLTGAKKPLSPQDAIALVNKMVAAGKIDQGTADKKIQAIQNGK